MPPEDLPEDKEQSYPCDCGGNVTLSGNGRIWECYECFFFKDTGITPRPWIVCAAIKSGHTIITGARHFDTIMQPHVSIHKDYTDEICIKWEQGFIDQFGNFYNRKDALQIVKESGQPFNAERNSGSGNELYSEGLY